MLQRKKKTKKIRKYSWRQNKFFQLKRKKILFRTIRATLVIGSIIGLIYLYTITIWSPKFQIQTVKFDENSIATLEYLPLYTNITQLLKSRNYLFIKRRWRDALLTDIQATDPIVSSVALSLIEDKTILVKLQFYTPNIVFQTPDGWYISHDEYIYPVSTDSPLSYTILPIQLPGFTSWRQDINGIFREVSEQQLKASVDMILSTLSSAAVQELIYQPGGQQLFLTYKGKRIYLNLRKDINSQLEKMIELENNRSWFATTRTIDLGSREEVIVK